MRRFAGVVAFLALVLTAVPAGASTADTPLPASWWTSNRTFWTIDQARTALLSVPIIVAGLTNDGRAQWLFAPQKITTLRGSGPGRKSAGGLTWSRFEVRMGVRPRQGFWRPVPGGPAVVFCLHANGQVQTAYPWSEWVASGFRTGSSSPGATGIVCGPSLANRQAVAIPFRR